MTNTAAPWWEVIELRAEVKASDGAIDDVQMSLHDAVFGKEGIGAGRTPYAEAGYYGDITHPTGSLVELMARVAVRLGVPGSTQTSALWRLDQAMGGGKSHGLIGLWHLAAHPEELSRSDLGREVFATAESIAGRGNIRTDLGNPRCVVLDCDNTTAAEEDFGPAKRLGERFLWRLFDKDGHRYDAFKTHITNKAKMAEALRSTGRPVLILIDEIMDYIRVAAAADPDGAVLDMAFLRVLLDVSNDVPNCVAVVVMIASDKDNMAMNREGEKHRAELEDLLTRNARTTAVTGGGDFAEIIQRRLFSTRPSVETTDAVAERYLSGMRGAWHTKVFKKLGDYRETDFRRRVRRCYPFHPDLIALAEDEWAQHAGFQRVRSIIRVFASAAHEQSRRAAAGEWAPELIDSGDLPLQSNLLKDALLNSGLVADDRTQANLREVAGVDIIDQHNPERGAARRLDTLRDEGWSHHNPRPAERMATALFVRSLCPRASGSRGATEAELLAASFVPGGGYGTGDAEAVAAELLETDEGVASVELLPGRGSAPRRWVFETRKTLAMLTRAEKKTVSNAARDKAVTDRAFEIASSGPFDKIVQVDGGDIPERGVTTAGCIGVLEQAGIDNKHQARLVILDSRWFSLLNGNDSATREAIAAALGTGPNPMAVQWASSAVFACANTAVRGQARGLAAEWLARERVAVLPAVQADREMKRRAREEAKEAKKRLDKMVQQCYRHIVYLAPQDEFNRVMAFRRMRRDTQSSLSGADVWDELREARKAFRLGEFDHNVLLHNLRDNDEGRPLSEIRDSFWSNPHKPLLPAGASELRDAIYAAIRSSDLELVSPNGEIYEVQTSGDITLSSHHIRLRRAVCSTPGTSPPPPPPPPRPPDPEPDGKTRHWQITLSINTTLDPDAPHDELVHLLRVVTNHIDDGRVRHINQATQFTIRAEIDDKETITALAEEARASINIIPL
ncbi:MAG: DUF499 domain-containing protein [Acidimicrobiia bacterium]|nr:DUF499 domain-containing protein [Acidimicrobiia bacterium]